MDGWMCLTGCCREKRYDTLMVGYTATIVGRSVVTGRWVNGRVLRRRPDGQPHSMYLRTVSTLCHRARTLQYQRVTINPRITYFTYDT